MSKPRSSAPWMPVKYKKADIAAIQALRNGNANADQQSRALGYIIETICARNDMSFHPGPGGELETAFAEGRRFVGNQIVKLTKIPLSKLNEDNAND